MPQMIRLFSLILCLSLAPILKAQAANAEQDLAQEELFALLTEVLEVWGLQARFKVAPTDQIDTIRAIPEQKSPLLAYNPGWIKSIRPEGAEAPDWSRYAEAAHQIAHLQMGHAERNANSELEADWYAGFVLGAKGASHEHAEAYRYPAAGSSESDVKIAVKRMEAVLAGWRSGLQQEKWRAAGHAPYLLPSSGHEAVTEKQLEQLEPGQLRLARNEIFARHGYRFKDPELEHYFRKKLWYLPRTSEVTLNKIEQANVALIRKWEQNTHTEAPLQTTNHPASGPTSKTHYIYPASNQRLLTKEELYSYSPAALRLIRNEIFARHGHRFQSPDLKRYFAKQSWYQPGDQSAQLSAIEQANVKLLRSMAQR